jgi:pimeloyl-ACP methyl ester carboxylesterase
VARWHCFLTQMRLCIPSSSAIAPRTAASSRLYRSYWRLAQAILLRRAFEGQRLQAPTQVLFGANDFYIPVAVLEEIEAHGADLTLEVAEGCSHWIPEERPELIADRARALFCRQ